jgi:hypothetical protein
MTDDDVRLSALFQKFYSPLDPGFATRVIALAAYEAKVRRARRGAAILILREALALVAVLIGFCVLTLQSPGEPLGLGDVLPLSSPMMFGVALLASWALVNSHSRSVA